MLIKRKIHEMNNFFAGNVCCSRHTAMSILDMISQQRGFRLIALMVAAACTCAILEGYTSSEHRMKITEKRE